eukprot:scaffold223539_cov26-Tisochrysis_lutea.AAC.2
MREYAAHQGPQSAAARGTSPSDLELRSAPWAGPLSTFISNPFSLKAARTLSRAGEERRQQTYAPLRKS